MTSTFRRFMFPFALVLLAGAVALVMGTGAAAGACPPVQNSTRMTIVYGSVTVDGLAAPVGSVVAACSPRGDVVGCTVVEEARNEGSLTHSQQLVVLHQANNGGRSYADKSHTAEYLQLLQVSGHRRQEDDNK